MNALSRGIALAMAIHAGGAGLALTGSGHGRARAGTSPAAIVEIDTLTLDAPPAVRVEIPVEAPASPSTVSALPDHTHPYPVPSSHDVHPHDASLAHPHDPIAATEPSSAPEASSDVAPSPSVASVEQALPRFTIALGAHGATGTAGGGERAATGAGVPSSNAPLLASEVSVQARLVTSVPSVYPPGARSDDLEGDVSLEIVLDTDGSVVDARVLRAAGHGFDESALTAVRRYRFTSAQRHGHPVRVRMPWTVQFRLR